MKVPIISASLRIPSPNLACIALVSGLAFVGGCAPLGGAAILTAGVGNATAIGIERSFDGAIIKTVTEKTETVVDAVGRAIGTMGFEVTKSATDDGVTTIRAKSSKRNVRVKLTAVATNATRIRIDVDEGFFLTQDPATAGEIMVQIETALHKPD